MKNPTGPFLTLLEKKCRENISRMASKARKANVLFRPHFKTHQSIEIGNWFRDEGVTAITVSSMKMAEHFIKKGGWRNVTLAFPFNPGEIETYNSLTEIKDLELNLVTASAEVLNKLNQSAIHSVGVFIKVDIGNQRAGVDPTDQEEIYSLLRIARPKIKIKGFLGHAGNSYKSRTKDEIFEVHENSLKIMATLKTSFSDKLSECRISVGDTPTCSIADNFPGADEIRPGNFVFFDEMQLQIGSCSRENISLLMHCPVVDVRHKKSELIIHGGGVHFSKDAMVGKDGKPWFGQLMKWNGEENYSPVDGGYVSSLSQEHGVVKIAQGTSENYKPGDILPISVVHSCLTADLMGGYYSSIGKKIDHFGSGRNVS